jgi:hypothetical protein
MELNFTDFRKQIINNWRALNWRWTEKLVVFVWQMKKYYIEPRRKVIAYVK